MAEEKIEKGIISEDALDEIAGGIGVSKKKLIKGLAIAGITIVGAGTLVSLGYLGKKVYDKHKYESELAYNYAPLTKDAYDRQQSRRKNPLDGDIDLSGDHLFDE